MGSLVPYFRNWSAGGWRAALLQIGDGRKHGQSNLRFLREEFGLMQLVGLILEDADRGRNCWQEGVERRHADGGGLLQGLNCGKRFANQWRWRRDLLEGSSAIGPLAQLSANLLVQCGIAAGASEEAIDGGGELAR